MAKIDIQQIRRDLKRSVNSLANLAYGAALEKFEAAKRELILEFMEHPVTREIQGGAYAPNFSETLDGYGNLFSFIGFEEGSDPLEEVINILEDSIILTKTPLIKQNGNLVTFTFTSQVPFLKEFEQVTQYPDGWNSGSWIIDIEHNIPNLRYYLSDKAKEFNESRSGPAIQVKTAPRGQASFKRIDYLSTMLAKFVAQVKRNV